MWGTTIRLNGLFVYFAAVMTIAIFFIGFLFALPSREDSKPVDIFGSYQVTVKATHTQDNGEVVLGIIRDAMIMHGRADSFSIHLERCDDFENWFGVVVEEATPIFSQEAQQGD